MTGAVETGAVELARVGVGTAALAVAYGVPGAERHPPARAGAARTLALALERGVRFFDTAPAYGEAESLLGEVLHGSGLRERCIVATKLAIPQAGWHALSARATHAHVRASAQASLRALRCERLDVLQIHNADRVLIEDGAVLDALLGLRAEGRVARLGATVYGEENALAAIATPALEVVQIAYSALDRRPERRVLPAAAANDTTLVARSLLLHGVLTAAGRDLSGSLAPLAQAAELVRHALGVPWSQLPGAAAAFVARRPEIAWALLGPRDEPELRELLNGMDETIQTTAVVPRPELSSQLLDPSRWPQESGVGA